MNSYHSQLAFTGAITIGGLAVGQQALVGAALVAVGGAALCVRAFWRRGKELHQA